MANGCILYDCRGAGSSLLNKPARIEQITRSMSSVLSCPLTIKVCLSSAPAMHLTGKDHPFVLMGSSSIRQTKHLCG